jgi:hypothetical protein
VGEEGGGAAGGGGGGFEVAVELDEFGEEGEDECEGDLALLATFGLSWMVCRRTRSIRRDMTSTRITRRRVASEIGSSAMMAVVLRGRRWGWEVFNRASRLRSGAVKSTMMGRGYIITSMTEATFSRFKRAVDVSTGPAEAEHA